MPSTPTTPIWVPRTVLKLLVTIAAAHHPLEVGGMLLGYRSEDVAVIVEATLPGVDAVHAEASYEPDQARDETIVAERYRATGGTAGYLGDWHSHPCGTVGLSRTDRQVLRRISEYGDARQTTPVMAIVAGAPDETYKVGAWVYSPWTLGPLVVRTEAKLVEVQPY